MAFEGTRKNFSSKCKISLVISLVISPVNHKKALLLPAQRATQSHCLFLLNNSIRNIANKPGL
jgi:hypothetical protein